MRSLLRSRRIRWAAPVVVFGVIALVAALPSLTAGADIPPNLPPITAQALIEKVQTAQVDGLSGTIKLSNNLGIPDLSGVTGALGGGGGGFTWTSLLSGAHSAQVWASKDGFKATYNDSLTSENDVFVNHTDLWTWQSQGSKVTHAVLPAGSAAEQPSSAPEADSPVQTPDQVAQNVLNALAPSSDVSVATPAVVADRPAYELVLAPKAGTPSAQSTVDHIALAVDSATGLPVEVQVFATGQAAPAIDFGFTSLTIGAPAASTFTFTPPPGSHVTTNTLVPHQGATHPADAGSQPTTVGQDWATVGVFHNVQLSGQVQQALSRGSTSVAGGQLFHTALVNVLVLDNGNVAIGAVNPAALEAAAATAG